MAAHGASASLVHPDALDEVFDIIDANGDGVLTVNEFIMVRASRIREPRHGPPETCHAAPPSETRVDATRASTPNPAARGLAPRALEDVSTDLRPLRSSEPSAHRAQALRRDPEVGRLLDLGTVVGQEHDSRDLFEKVFQRLDADSSLDVTRAEFKRYFCPLDDTHEAGRRAEGTNDEASPGDSAPGTPPSGASHETKYTTSEYASPSLLPLRAARNVPSPLPSRSSPRAKPPGERPAQNKSSTSVFSQASGSVQDDWPPSPPPPAGGCCGLGAKRAKAPPRFAPPRAAAYRAPGAPPVAAASFSSAEDNTSRSSAHSRSPPKPFRPPAAREGDGAAREGKPPSPLAPRRADANVLVARASRSPSARSSQVPEPSPAGDTAGDTVVDTIVEKVVEKVYNISDEELASLKNELELLREQVRSKGETLRSKDKRLGEMEKENASLRAEYNLQSLKQDMLVHMWSMHMLDADVEDDAST
jgi:hypothetical protein